MSQFISNNECIYVLGNSISAYFIGRVLNIKSQVTNVL